MPRLDPITPATRSRALWRALLDEIASFDERSRRRGWTYAVAGHVGEPALDGAVVAAQVRGTQVYSTEWRWDGFTWDPGCSCPAGPDCKHACALACVLLHRAQLAGLLDDRRAHRLVPTFLPAALGKGPVLEPTAAPPGPAREEALDPPPAPGRPSRPFASATAASRPANADTLRRARTVRDRMDVLDRMLSGAPAGTAAADRFLPPAILNEADPELMVWRVTREIARMCEGWLPEALEGYRDRPELAQRLGARFLPAVEEEILTWAARRRERPQRELRAELVLVADALGHPAIRLRARLTSPRQADAPRTLAQLEGLWREEQRMPGLLAPAQASLVAAIADAARDTGFGYSRDTELSPQPRTVVELLRGGAHEGLITWGEGSMPEFARRAGARVGEPVQLHPERPRVQPVCHTSPDGPRLTLAAFWPDGGQRALDDVLLFDPEHVTGRRQPLLLIADGAVHVVAEEPPPELQRQLDEVGSVLLPSATRAALLATLSASFPSVAASIAPHVLEHDVELAATVRLDAGDWFQFRLFAHTAGEAWNPADPPPPGAACFEYTPEGRWERSGPEPRGRRMARGQRRDVQALAPEHEAPAAPPDDEDLPAMPAVTPGDVWLEVPSAQRVAPVTDWLAATGARPGIQRMPGGLTPGSPDAFEGWWLRLSRANADVVADAWHARPREVRWFADARAAALLGRPRRAVARLSVRSTGIDFFSVSAQWEAEGQAISDADLARLRTASTAWVRLSGGWARRDALEISDRLDEVLADLGIEPGAGEQRVTLWQLAQARPESLAELETLGVDAEALEAIRALRAKVAAFEGLPRVPVPAGVRAELRPYQQEGLDFLAYGSSLGLGAVLADDMGLGKTVQALAWIEHLRERDPAGGPALVVCPTSVMHNWQREAERFTPGLRVLTLASGGRRHTLRKRIAAHDLAITNYALLRRDLEDWRETPLRALVLDEAQNIKNPDAAVAVAARALRAPHRLALTGTPLENRALDLWSILEVVNPGYLGDRRSFTARFDRADAPPHARALLAAKLRPVLLRRLKRQVALELPDRIEERRDCEMTRGQRALYLGELRRAREAMTALAADPDALKRNRISILAQLTHLRQICCHPSLVGGRDDLGSGKFDALLELLEPLLAEGHKVLVFSQFVRCLKLIETELESRGIRHHLLTGETTKRERVVAAFQDDPEPGVFLISLKAGGTGLNLTAASYVVLFDPWWNPAVEAQAIDRTHRIGQDRTVIAYRLIAAGTLEERIYELQERKAALVKDVLGEDGFARALDREALEYLLAEA